MRKNEDKSPITLEMVGLEPAAKPMVRLMALQAFAYLGYFGKHAECGLHVFESHGRTVFIATELPENPGTSITNRAEVVAETIEELFGLPHVFGDKPRNTNYTYVEHYPSTKRRGDFDENWAIVTFKDTQAPCLSHPRSKNSPQFYNDPNWVPVEREQIERLIGAPFVGFKFA